MQRRQCAQMVEMGKSHRRLGAAETCSWVCTQLVSCCQRPKEILTIADRAHNTDADTLKGEVVVALRDCTKQLP